MATQRLSRAAYERLTAELEDLTTRGRIEVAEKIARAREEGDLSENGGYHAAMDEQGHMEGRIRQLEHILEDVEIVEDHHVYTIVYEGDGAGRVSPSSPLGKALQGASAGETVTYDAPNGSMTVKVLSVDSV